MVIEEDDEPQQQPMEEDLRASRKRRASAGPEHGIKRSKKADTEAAADDSNDVIEISWFTEALCGEA